MLRATEIIKADAGFSGVIEDRVTLDFDSRRRRRMKLTADSGMDFLLDLDKVQTLREGDILRLENGQGISVSAANEAVLDVMADDAAHLVRIAWHLGNRHLPTQLMDDRLRIRQDHVIEHMLETKLGAKLFRLEAPFNPEGGAYGHGETLGHDHGHSHESAHEHEPPSGHGHSHG